MEFSKYLPFKRSFQFLQVAFSEFPYTDACIYLRFYTYAHAAGATAVGAFTGFGS